MGWQVVLGVGFVALVVMRRYAARRVAARQGRWVWIVFAPTLVTGLFGLWAAASLFTHAPLLGALVAVFAVVSLGALLLFVNRVSRGVTATRPDEDLTQAVTDPMVDYFSTVTGLMLIGGLIAVVGLIIWGVMQAAR